MEKREKKEAVNSNDCYCLNSFVGALQVAPGASLTKVGGFFVYSTCSLSPFENEAVVAEILNRAREKLVLVNAHGALPGLRSRPGVINWKVSEEGMIQTYKL